MKTTELTNAEVKEELENLLNDFDNNLLETSCKLNCTQSFLITFKQVYDNSNEKAEVIRGMVEFFTEEWTPTEIHPEKGGQEYL
jgi:hypothetical protein